NLFPVATDAAVPVVAGDEAVIDLVGGGYVFDPDNAPSSLSFEIVEGPQEATLDPLTGQLTYTAPADAANTQVKVVYRADDGCTPDACGDFELPTDTEVAIGHAQATGT